MGWVEVCSKDSLLDASKCFEQWSNVLDVCLFKATSCLHKDCVSVLNSMTSDLKQNGNTFEFSGQEHCISAFIFIDLLNQKCLFISPLPLVQAFFFSEQSFTKLWGCSCHSLFLFQLYPYSERQTFVTENNVYVFVILMEYPLTESNLGEWH